MITRFGTLFAGHVDLEDIGLAGIPVNDRWLPDDQLATVFEKAESIAVLMDDCGYDTFWLAEHHFQREGYECIPNLLLFGVHLCHLTEKIRIGCGFNIAPMWNPLRLAEDYATADILTGGRVIFGVGRGYHTREVESFGAPMLDQDANRDLFEEQVDIIFKAFNSRSFSHRGPNYTIPPPVPYRGYQLEEITLVPRPANLPVECYQPLVSASPRGIDFMIKHGIKGMLGGGAAPGGAADRVVAAWRDALARSGRETELGQDLIIGFSVHLADTEAKAIAEAERFAEEDMKMFAPLGFRKLSDEHLAALGDPSAAVGAGLPTVRDGVAAGSWLCGPPDLVAEKIFDVQERYPGLAEINVGSVVGTPKDVILEQLGWFAEDVMPRFKSQADHKSS
ncbi:MAG: LLM class flavin-dependent oxidoreductase [Chloroflexota bacterium]|nr:LLM class flavin-dependent oxidoreductase [Chloroflexota bacterium]MDE2935912.1 LLM class flavin-dependent oxidoreductase [Chloroflexota bacterium]MXY12702.1 LLM class flavin-dependent oxidoreductase [Chloroflexota bacterium]